MKNQNRRGFIKTGALTGSLLLLQGSLGRLRAFGDNGNCDSTNILTPITDNLMQNYGILDVTSAPYFADPTGKKDSTKAIQEAVNASCDKGLVCFFPGGTYMISDTISCEQRVTKLEQPRYLEYMRQTYWDSRDRFYLLGSSKGTRPVLKISPDAKGFDDPASPKLALRIWAQTRNDYQGRNEPMWGWEQPDITFGHIFRGIDFDLGGHPGAVGLRHPGAQGSFVIDSKINANGAFAGFSNCPGHCGGAYNIEVYGGRYGMIIDEAGPHPQIISSVFKGQTLAPILNNRGHALVLTGCIFETTGTAIVDIFRISPMGISMIDCIVTMNNGGQIFRHASKLNIFIENVFVKGAENIQTGDVKIPRPNKWTEISRYAACSDIGQTMINGVRSTNTITDWKSSVKRPDENYFLTKHWSKLPSFEDADVVNIKTFGATGDGTSDDTEALKKAMNGSRKIFFPPGRYKISETLNLAPDLTLFGIKAASIDTPGLSTFNHPEDKSVISFISISRLDWKSGKGVYSFGGGQLKITENGGGRIYALMSIGRAGGPLIEGTSQPIAFYALNVERIRANPQASMINAKHVRIYYLKVEATTDNYGGGAPDPTTGNTPMAFVNCEDIKLYCMNGNVETWENRPMLDIVDSKKVLASSCGSFRTGNYANIREKTGETISEIPSNRVGVLLVRD